MFNTDSESENNIIEPDVYKTIKSLSKGFFKDKGSKFLSCAYPFSDVSELKNIIENIKKEHYNARHHCFAYMLGHERLQWRTNDDGEPSGTAGKPILGQINSAGLTNILIVVTRYFGGTLLGVSGLINAYRSAAASAIENSEIIELLIQEYYEITYPYSSMNDVMKILKEEEVEQSEHNFEQECKIKINFRVSSKEKMLSRLSRVNGLVYKHITTK